MFESKILAGLLAAIPLAFVMTCYMWIRSSTFVETIREGEDLGNITDTQLKLLLLSAVIGMSIMLGIAAGVVYSRVDSTSTFLLIAVGLAVVLSILAVISSTPLIPDKIVMNTAVALILGLLVPWLAS